jgi:hypothetical protein
MKEKYYNYYNELLGGKLVDDYIVYNMDGDSESIDYSDLYNQILNYYNVTTFTEESDEQKAKRLAKEKAEKRNGIIDQILGV